MKYLLLGLIPVVWKECGMGTKRGLHPSPAWHSVSAGVRGMRADTSLPQHSSELFNLFFILAKPHQALRHSCVSLGCDEQED